LTNYDIMILEVYFKIRKEDQEEIGIRIPSASPGQEGSNWIFPEMICQHH